MKHFVLIILSIVYIQVALSQTEPSMTLDPLTGNYILSYQSYNGEDREVIFEPATKIEPSINAKVFFDSDSSIFKYEYSVKNGANSQQRLLSFLINYFTPIYSITKPNNQWSARHYSFTPVFSWSHTKVSPYGVRTPRSGIAPDSSVTGFSFESSGLPSIINSYSRGAARTLHFIEEPPDDAYSLLEPLRKFPANTVHRKTLGPKDPPEPFVVNDFVDTLISYEHQAFELGWIDNQGILNSLDSKLNHVKKQLEKDNITTAINGLKAFVNEVEAQKDKHLTSEAYALLKYNTEFLMGKLSEE